VNYAKTYLTGAFPDAWLYVLGALFILVTLLLPRGIIGRLPARNKAKSNVKTDERIEVTVGRGS
jgi:urea transport system permease protein